MRINKHFKPIAALLIIIAMSAVIISGCAPSRQNALQPDTELVQSNTRPLSFMFNSPELTEQFNEMAAAYRQHAGIEIKMEIRQNDYTQLLKTRINAGNIPDLFITSAYNDNKVYKNYSYNLADESFIQEVEPAMLLGVMEGDNVTGLPFLVQSHSFIYNKLLFEQAGIQTLPVTLDDYREVCEQLAAAGITPFSTGYADWWVLPQTFYPSASDIEDGDYEGLFAKLKNGEASVYEYEELAFALDVLDLIARFGGENPMKAGFEEQCADFAAGNVAIIHQGSWAEQKILEQAPDITMGYLCAPRLDGNGTIAVDSNLTFRVYKDSPYQAETLAFLEWLVTSEYGRAWIPQKIKQISPLKGAQMPDTPLSEETGSAIARCATSAWWIFEGPDNIEQLMGIALQDYVAGRATRDETMSELGRLFGGNGTPKNTGEDMALNPQ